MKLLLTLMLATAPALAADDATDLTGPAYWQGVCDGLTAAGLWVRAVRHDNVETPCAGLRAAESAVYEWDEVR